MTSYDELAKRLHPSAINLAAIPMQSNGYDRHAAIRDTLLRLAAQIDGELRGVVSQWKAYRDTTPPMEGSMDARKSVYDGLNCAIGVLQREWERNGFAGAVLAIMPPTDGYDDTGNERQGIADYAALITDGRQAECSYPDCGCAESRLCNAASGPNDAACTLNRPRRKADQ